MANRANPSRCEGPGSARSTRDGPLTSSRSSAERTRSVVGSTSDGVAALLARPNAQHRDAAAAVHLADVDAAAYAATQAARRARRAVRAAAPGSRPPRAAPRTRPPASRARRAGAPPGRRLRADLAASTIPRNRGGGPGRDHGDLAPVHLPELLAQLEQGVVRRGDREPAARSRRRGRPRCGCPRARAAQIALAACRSMARTRTAVVHDVDRPRAPLARAERGPRRSARRRATVRRVHLQDVPGVHRPREALGQVAAPGDPAPLELLGVDRERAQAAADRASRCAVPTMSGGSSETSPVNSKTRALAISGACVVAAARQAMPTSA